VFQAASPKAAKVKRANDILNMELSYKLNRKLASGRLPEIGGSLRKPPLKVRNFAEAGRKALGHAGGRGPNHLASGALREIGYTAMAGREQPGPAWWRGLPAFTSRRWPHNNL
jgi:hypothetical protein